MKQIIDQYKKNIKAIIRNLTGSQNEDLEQEVYIRTWKNLDKYNEQGKFRQWISTVTANICKDYLKSSHTKNAQNTVSEDETLQIPSLKDNVEYSFEVKLRRKRVAEAITALKPKLQEVIVMYEIDGLDYNEIAERLNCPQGTVKSRIFKARQELSTKLQDLL